MNKRFLVIIEDDFELMGDGAGNVAALQYLPALALMNIAANLGVKLTFMVEVAQQLVLRNFLDKPGVRLQQLLWEETVLLLKERGFDVQLHLHPQWLEARYVDGKFILGDIWNIGLLESSARAKLFSDAIEYLQVLIRKIDPTYQVCAYKAGHWGLQPSLA